jgi:ribosomal protein S18 acetylase RimI-like enzyme
MTLTAQKPILLDEGLRQSDVGDIRALVTETGIFTLEEIDIACELAIDTLSGKDEDYKFLILRDDSGRLIAYTCYGFIPLADYRFDLYWIAVSPGLQGKGIGYKLLEQTEKKIRELKGEHIYAETSSIDGFNSARSFYLKNGFTEVSRIKEFYRAGDDKVTYQKIL